MVHSISPPPFSWGGQHSVPNFGKVESEKNGCLVGLKEFLPWIIAWGAYYDSCQKKTFKNTLWL